VCFRCGTSEEEKARLREGATYRAEMLERMAQYERRFAKGTLQPHSHDAEKVRLLARSLIRYLAEDWI
jgi:hypothetical protein